MAHHSSALLSSNDSTTQELLEVKRKCSGRYLFVKYKFGPKQLTTMLCTFSILLTKTIRSSRKRSINKSSAYIFSELQKSSCRLEEERCSSPPITLNSQVTELIAQMRDGLQIKDVKSSQLIEIFQEKVQLLLKRAF